MSHSAERIAALEARIDELERSRSRPVPRLPRLGRRLALLALSVALLLPAGAVLASHQFSDVPTSHQFHNSIDAIADAGITTGCGGGKYCPNGLVTRGQMAAFLNRLGALTPGSAPKVNADRLDGKHASQLSRVAGMQTASPTVIPVFSEIQHGSDLVITAPSAGFVLVNAAVTFNRGNCTSWCQASMRVVHAESGVSTVSASIGETETGVTGRWMNDTASVSYVFPVAAGANTFRILLDRTNDSDADGSLSGGTATATALFTPFGPTGSAP